MSQILLHTHNLSVGYRTSHRAIKIIQKNLNLKLYAGELVSLLGTNGIGKSTLMRTLAGLQKPLSGSVNLDNQAISQYTVQQLAKKLSLVLTDRIEIGNFSVRDLIGLGRYPYTGWLGNLTPEDEDMIDWAMQVTETQALAGRNLYELSDGERQKVMIARALAQTTSLIFLDEPTAHLDVPNRVMIFQLLHRLAQETNKTILLATHELDLALQISDRVWLMSGDEVVYEDIPENLVLNGTFARLFQKESLHFETSNGTFQVRLQPTHAIHLKCSDPTLYFWVSRALARIGWQAVESELTENQIIIHNLPNKVIWELKLANNPQNFDNLAHLLNFLRNKEQI
ncbi:MAG: ABC transporter ATP-binding protein [Microscillaceae bacterium]|jgi:iron complex transport system ATP-binding protein|nr:ABC transporter ATP-binding protein [Microscillaceae bacterium]